MTNYIHARQRLLWDLVLEKQDRWEKRERQRGEQTRQTVEKSLAQDEINGSREESQSESQSEPLRESERTTGACHQQERTFSTCRHAAETSLSYRKYLLHFLLNSATTTKWGYFEWVTSHRWFLSPFPLDLDLGKLFHWPVNILIGISETKMLAYLLRT